MALVSLLPLARYMNLACQLAMAASATGSLHHGESLEQKRTRRDVKCKKPSNDEGRDGRSHERSERQSGKSSSSSSSDSSELDAQDVVNVDFEFYDPKPGDYHGLNALLRSYLDDTAWDLSGFVDIILSQTTVGTVMKTEEEESPIGVVSALNMGRYQDHACLRDLCKFLTSKCSDKPETTQLKGFINKCPHYVGLLVSERLLNLPMEVVLPLHDGLFDEVTWATEDEPSEALRNSFKFKYYLIMTRVFQKSPKKKALQRKKKKKEKGSFGDGGYATISGSPGDLIYIKPEDEIFHQLSDWSFTFSVNAESLAAHETSGMRQLRLVMGVAAQKIPSFRSQLATLVQAN